MSDTLRSLIEGEIQEDRKTLEKYSKDTSLFRVTPKTVVYPKNTKDVCALVSYASQQITAGADVSLTARSAGTDMTGGPLNESIIVDFTRHFNHILHIDGDEATVEPGVYYRDFDKETLKHERILPSYPASRELCTLGGMVSNNSGGEKTLTYGKSDRYVRSLQVVLSDGNEYTIKPLTLQELAEKEQLDTFEGSFYRAMHELVTANKEALQKAAPDVSKNSSGYALWNILDEENEIFDLTKLFVGSQGTLGFVTEATVGLVKPKTESRMLVIFLRDMDILADLINTVLKFKPESFESYDDHTFHIAMKLFPQIVRRLKGNMITLGFKFIPEFWAVLTGGVPKLILMAEFTADTDEEAYAMAQAAQKGIAQYGLKTHITKNQAEAEKYWVVRREAFALLRQKVKNVSSTPFIEDIAVKPEHLPEFLPQLYALLDEYGLTYTIQGHVGDGNFHIFPLMDLTKAKTKEVIYELGEKVNHLIWKFHGSNTGEHNDGILRSPYLPEMYGPEVFTLFEQTKQIFDPKNIFNPGKKVNANLAYSQSHIDTHKS